MDPLWQNFLYPRMAPIENSDQPVHLRCLIRAFNGCFMGSKESNDSSGRKLRLWSTCVDVQTDLNIRYKHMSTCTLLVIPAQIIP